MYSNYPLTSSDIFPPIPSNYGININKSNYPNINIDVSRLIKKNNEMIESVYLDVVDTINNFTQPNDSNTMIKRVNYNNYKKTNPVENTFETYNNMTEYMNNVKPEQIDMIKGTPIANNYISVMNMYNPIYSNIDLTNNNYIPKSDTIERKYQPYEPHYGPSVFVNDKN